MMTRAFHRFMCRSEPGYHTEMRTRAIGESLPYLGRSVQLTVHPVDGNQVEVRFHHWQFDVDVPRPLDGDERVDTVRAAFEDWYRARAAVKLPRGSTASRASSASARHGSSSAVSASAGPAARRTGRFASTGARSWPPALVDYIVAHELAHLRARGHGADYWAVVAQGCRITGGGGSDCVRSGRDWDCE